MHFRNNRQCQLAISCVTMATYRSAVFPKEFRIQHLHVIFFFNGLDMKQVFKPMLMLTKRYKAKSTHYFHNIFPCSFPEKNINRKGILLGKASEGKIVWNRVAQHRMDKSTIKVPKGLTYIHRHTYTCIIYMYIYIYIFIFVVEWAPGIFQCFSVCVVYIIREFIRVFSRVFYDCFTSARLHFCAKCFVYILLAHRTHTFSILTKWMIDLTVQKQPEIHVFAVIRC